VPVASDNPISYPHADAALGEKLFPDEAALAEQLADTIEKTIREQYQPGNARRDVHAKATGFLKAEFRVHETLPDNLARGVFVPGKIYQALIRFSNGSANAAESDNHQDGRGMAIKLLNVPGEKILESDRHATTQDFVMINHPVFFTNDPQSYLSLLQKAGSSNLLAKMTIPFALGLKGTALAMEIHHGKISNPLQTRYFSASPYQWGVGPDRQVIKFSVVPVSAAVDPMPDNPGPDYLREAMQATLQKSTVGMKFLVQPKIVDNMSVEDSTTEWQEAEAPFHEVATIHIPQQDFDTPEQNALGENLSFTPWHALPEHRPLGSLNRIRKIVYERVSLVRHAMNSLERREP